jgi:hypothetical protein
MGDEPADAALPSPLVELDDDRLSSHGVRLWLKRDDLIHPALPGNKWRKLLPNQRALGFSALRGGEFLVDEVERLQIAAFGARSGRGPWVGRVAGWPYSDRLRAEAA